MKITILFIIFSLGVLLPLFWIAGTLTSIVYFFRHREKAAATLDTRQPVAFNPQLGFTMADGGDAIDEEKKEASLREDSGRQIKHEGRELP